MNKARSRKMGLGGWILVASAIVFGLWQGGLFANQDGLFAEGAALDAMQKILRKWPAGTRIHSIDITRTEMKVIARSSESNAQFEEYTYRTIDHGRGSRARRGLRLPGVYGPSPADPVILKLEQEKTWFEVGEVDLKDVPKVAREATRRVKLEGGGKTVAIRIDRALSNIRWDILVRGPNEEARAVADAAGQISSINLARTRRGRETDFLKGGEPLEAALKTVRERFGTERIFREIEMSRDHVSLTVRDPEKPNETLTYSCRVDGLSQGTKSTLPPDIRRYVEAPVKEGELFTLDDADWTLVPKIAVAGLEIAGLEKGKIFAVSLTRNPESPSGMMWRVKVMESLISPIVFIYYDAKSGEFIRK